jgi:RNA polymerase sigma-70 factor (ECF subfamily)
MARCDVESRMRASVLANHAFVWRCLRRLGVREANADDAAQHVFLVLAGRLRDVPVEREKKFLFNTALRVAANARRVQARVREEGWNDDPPDVPSDTLDPEQSLSEARRRALLDEVLAALPLELRTVFVLTEFERMSAPEVASLIDVPVGTVASRLRRARELVEEQIRHVRARFVTQERRMRNERGERS